MIYGYARVSTKEQETKGYSLKDQEKDLISERCIKIYKDGFTGIKTDRPQFKKLLSVLNAGDTLVVTKLDRFARSVIDGTKIVQDLIEKDVKINILNMGYLDNTPASKLTRTIFFAFAEFEREMIIERTQAGKAIAKEKQGFCEGRPPKYTDHQINSALDLLKNNSYTEVERMTKISKSTLTRAMRKRKNK